MSAKTMLSALAVLAALGFAASAHAAPASSDPDAISVKVSVGDLNLASEGGARTVLQRIHNAARTICGDEPDLRSIHRSDLYRACMKVTVDRTVAALDTPMVTALNAGHSPPATILAASR